MSNNVVVGYEKEYLTGMSAGRKFNCYIVCSNPKSARELAQDMRKEPVQEADFSGELVRYRKVRVERFTKAK